MRIEDSEEFFQVWDQAASIYRLPPAETGAKKMTFKMLSRYELADIKAALQVHMADPVRGVYPPKPADVVRVIQQHSRNQFPGPEEAWARFPRDESSSACVCEEMSRAWGVASEQDEISGRMAFKEAYSREVAKSQAMGREPVWYITTGRDKQQLEEVALESVRERLISPEAARAYIPHMPVESLRQLASGKVSAGLLLEQNQQTVNSLAQLTAPDAENDTTSAAEAKAHLAKLAAMLNAPEPEPEVEEKTPEQIATDEQVARELASIKSKMKGAAA